MKGGVGIVKIDVYAHICPQKFIDAFAKTEQGVSWEKICGDASQMGGLTLWDIDKRLERLST